MDGSNGQKHVHEELARCVLCCHPRTHCSWEPRVGEIHKRDVRVGFEPTRVLLKSGQEEPVGGAEGNCRGSEVCLLRVSLHHQPDHLAVWLPLLEAEF